MDGSYIDGNALAGELSTVFALEPTTARCSCGGCGEPFILAQARAYVGGPGQVLRCPNCEQVVLRIVRTTTRAWIELTGLDSMSFTVDPGSIST
ncbi:DUF6510 family protein [Phycicoccus sp. Root101]|uniref:DUF6510 family protein n=1 Tax=Phycicoccus sp. Root101 TaxID=1736421 RepID=UPI0009E6C965